MSDGRESLLRSAPPEPVVVRILVNGAWETSMLRPGDRFEMAYTNAFTGETVAVFKVRVPAEEEA